MPDPTTQPGETTARPLPLVLIVDDDPSVVASLELLLERRAYRTASATGPEGALERVARAASEAPDLVLQDMNFSRDTSGREGIELLEEIRRRRPELPVVLITAWGSIQLAVEGMKAGAADFVTKPWANERVLSAVETALSLAAQHGAGNEAPPERSELDAEHDFSGLIGRDPALLDVLRIVARVAPTDATVLVSGESGTGKELVAEAIHRNSRRGDGPFVKVNLGGISSTLFESEMFGHARGAFTDAKAERKGRFELADGGTIFLDEIGEIDPSAQVKLLRVLQDRSYEVLGSSTTRTVDLRVVAATNRDLAQMVDEGTFREDLLYRLNLISVGLPPLRERRGDVAPLARHFLAKAAERFDRSAPGLSAEAVRWLERQSWPGNVRQLEQTMARVVLVSDRERLGADELVALDGLTTRQRRGGIERGELPTPGSMTLDQVERAMIERCMEHFGGNITRAAEALGLSRPALYRRIEKHGLE